MRLLLLAVSLSLVGCASRRAADLDRNGMALLATAKDDMLARATSDAPFDPNAYFPTKAQTETLAGAEFALRKAAELAPKVARYHHHLGLVLWRVGKRDEAMTRFRHAQQLDPLYAPVAATLRRIEEARLAAVRADTEATTRRETDRLIDAQEAGRLRTSAEIHDALHH